MKQTPNYIRNLLLPQAQAPQARRVWSIDLETVWLPFFTATNTMGDTAIPSDALGCPIRLAYDKDGSVKFSKSGRPVSKVAKPIADSVTLVRQNFVANLQHYAQQVADGNQEDFAKQVALSVEAGKPINAHDREAFDKAVQLQIENALAEAEGEALAEAQADSQTEETPVPEKELATVS